MKLPPLFIRMHITPRGRRGFGLWLPLVLLWPLLIPAMVVVLLVCLLADLLTAGRFRLAAIWLATCLLLCELRGLRVRVNGKRTGDDVYVSIN